MPHHTSSNFKSGKILKCKMTKQRIYHIRGYFILSHRDNGATTMIRDWWKTTKIGCEEDVGCWLWLGQKEDWQQWLVFD